ncbi:IS5/IS1182 family transposase, partial [Vibrio splendidus]
TFWIDEKAIRQVKPTRQTKSVYLFSFATALMAKRVCSMPLQGFIYSLFKLAHVPLSCLHYTCIS